MTIENAHSQEREKTNAENALYNKINELMDQINPSLENYQELTKEKYINIYMAFLSQTCLLVEPNADFTNDQSYPAINQKIQAYIKEERIHPDIHHALNTLGMMHFNHITSSDYLDGMSILNMFDEEHSYSEITTNSHPTVYLHNAGNYAIEFKTQDIESTNSKMDSIINTFQGTGLTFEKTFSEKEEKNNDEWKKEQEHVLTAKDENNNKILSFHYPRFPISHGENNHYLKIVNHSSYNLLGLKTGEKIHFYASDFDNDPFGNTDEDTTDSFSKKEGKAKEYFFNQNPSYVLDNGNPMKFTDATASVIDQLALAYKYINQLSALKKKIPLNTLNDKNEMIS